jgi:tetratricopeptide (TPR) repeat protein
LRGETDRRSADKRKLVLRWFYIIAPLLVIIYAYFQWHPIIEPPSEPQNPFIPFFAFKGFSYTLLSGQRILDIINENLLLAGVAFFIIAAILLSARKKISFSDPYLLCLIVNFLFYEAFLIGGNAGFGLARDWDVFSAIGIFAALISVALLRQIQFPSIKRLALPIILVSLLSISSWVYLNVRVRSAAARYEDIVEIYTPKIETKWAMMGYENLRKFHASRDITDELRVIRKMVERSPRHTTVQTAETDAMLHIEDINARGKEEFRMLVDHLKDLSDSLLREEVFAKVRIGPHGSGESITLGEQFEDGIMILYRKFGVFSLSEAIRNVDDLIAHHPSLPYGYELRGFLMYLFANDAKGAIPAIEKAIAIDTTRARPHLYLALALAKTGDRSRANAEFRSALALDPGWLGGLTYYSSFIADPQNDSVRADDISFASGLLKKVIDAPPESTLEAHVQTQNARAALAQRLLHEVEIRPVRHQ